MVFSSNKWFAKKKKSLISLFNHIGIETGNRKESESISGIGIDKIQTIPNPIHRAYTTPYKRFKMKLQSNLNCHISNTTSSGTFLHMFWECPVVISLWTHVNLVLSSLLQIDWSVNSSLCLLNDDSGLCISSMQKKMLFAGFTAAKKTIIQNWFTPHMCRKTYWIRSLLQIVTCEFTMVRVGGARPSTIDAWQCLLLDIRDCIKE